MLLEKVYQPDIMAYESGKPGAYFMIEVVEDASLAEEAERVFTRFLGKTRCYQGALVNQGRIKVLSIFPKAGGDYSVSVVADISAEEELRRFGSFAGVDWWSEANFFDWLQTYLQRGRADSMSQEDQGLLKREFIGWMRDAALTFTSMRGKSVGRAF